MSHSDETAVTSDENNIVNGALVQALYSDGHWYNAKILNTTEKGYLVNYYEWGAESTADVSKSDIKSPTEPTTATAIMTSTTISASTTSTPLAEWLKSMKLEKYIRSLEVNEYTLEMIKTLDVKEVNEMLGLIGCEESEKLLIKQNLNLGSDPDPDPLLEWLKELKLEKYLSSFREHEYELKMILEFDDAAIDDMTKAIGIKAGSKIKIRNDLQKRKKERAQELELLEWLRSMDLMKYHDTFRNSEYSDLNKIKNLDSSQVDAMIKTLGIKAGSAHKIKTELQASSTSDSPKSTPIKETDELLEWLQELKLEKYYQTFRDNEYDMKIILALDSDGIDDMLNTLNIKVGSRIKIKNDLTGRKNNKPGATDDGKDDAVENKDDVSIWLQSLKMSKYAKAFKKHEYQSLQNIFTFSDEQIEEMIQVTGVKAGSAIKLKNELKKSKEQETINAYQTLNEDEMPYKELAEQNDPKYRWIVNNEAMPSDWTPRQHGLEHLDQTNIFAKPDMSCSVRDTCGKIRNNHNSICTQLPKMFFVRSTRYQTYFRIKVEAKAI